MSSTENPLFFSASLAQTIGLNEAILIQFLQQSTALSKGQFSITQANCQQFFSFWNIEQIHQVFINLQGLGLIALNQSQGGNWAGQVVSDASAPTSKVTSKVFIPTPIVTPKKQAPKTAIQERVHNIVNESIVTKEVESTSPVTINVEPTEQIDRANEARLYNQSRGNPLGHLQQPKATPVYAQSNNSLSKMNTIWKPSEQFHEMLRLHNIPASFAEEQLPVFKQYYIDSGKTAMSWDSRFINWVQRAKASARSQEGQYEQKQTYADPGHDAKQRKEEVRRKLRDINDTSWAD